MTEIDSDRENGTEVCGGPESNRSKEASWHLGSAKVACLIVQRTERSKRFKQIAADSLN